MGGRSVAASSDNIELNASIEPVCEIAWAPQAIASNLDITSSVSELHIGNVVLASNTDGSSEFETNFEFDFSDHLLHSNNINTFSFSGVFVSDQLGDPAFPIPFGVSSYSGEDLDAPIYVSYTGVPSIHLLQGTYSTEWVVSCSVDPLDG